jgi:hypothetical protein
MIYTYVLTDTSTNPLKKENTFRADGNKYHAKAEPSTICFALLQTCRLVYLETYKLPMLLNPMVVYDFDVPARPNPHRLAPWQFALIQRLDVSLQQISLEGDDILNFLKSWKPRERHAGVYVAPRFYQREIHHRHINQSHNFGLVAASPPKGQKPQDGDEIKVNKSPFSGFYDRSKQTDSDLPLGRAMVARPLQQLTIRLARTDWWTWSSNPDDTHSRLGIDPAIAGNANYPKMMELAQVRREGGQLDLWLGWGRRIRLLPDLQLLQFVFETFPAKEDQLNTVVECAKLWKFPLEDRRYELSYSGDVETVKRTRSPLENLPWTSRLRRPRRSEAPSWQHAEETEVRVIKFTRRTVK